MSKYFCIYPFVSLETRNSGSVGLCCRSEPIGDIKTEGLLDMWNNDTIKQLRLDLLNGEKPEICQGCWQHEDIGIESKRTRNMNLDNPAGEYARFKDAERQMLPDGTMPIPPQHVEFRLNNLCNLKCRMCNPLDSSSWDDWHLVKDIVASVNDRLTNKIESMGLTELAQPSTPHK